MTSSVPTAFLIVLAAACAVLQVVLGATSLDLSTAPAASVAAMVVYSVLMAVMLRPGPKQLPAATSWSSVAGTVVITVLVQYGLPKDSWPGYAAWHPGALQWLLVVLAVRGRPWHTAIGCTLFTTLTIAWSLTTEPGIGQGARMALAPVIFVATAIALARFLDTTDRQAETKRRRALALLDDAARARERTVEAADWVKGVRDLALPSLALAADPNGPLPDHLRRCMLETEAALRDRVRGGSLATDEVLLRVSAARSRGITVHLLDDRGAVTPSHELGALVDSLDRLMPGLEGQGTLTVRARPDGKTPAITIVFAPSGAGESVYIEL